MKNKILIMYSIILGYTCANLNAQDYTLFNSKTAYVYKDVDSNFYSVKFHATSVTQKDTFLFLDTLAFQYYSKSIVGRETLKKANGDYLLFNSLKDTLLIKSAANPGDFWKLYKFKNGSFFQATVKDIHEENVFETKDSVKTIVLSKYDSTGTKISDSIAFIKIGKKTGLIAVPLLYNLTETIVQLKITGTERPHQGFTNMLSDGIFNFDVGDEFHYYEALYYGWHGISHSFIWSAKKILNKSITADSIVYLTEVRSKTIRSIVPDVRDQTNVINDTTAAVTTIQESFPRKDSVIDMIPGDQYRTVSIFYHPEDIGSSMGSYPTYGNVLQKSIDILFLNQYTFDYFRKFANGLGLISLDSSTSMYYDSSHKKELLYYKKGNIEWGAPIDPEVLAVTTPQDLVVRPLIYNDALHYQGNGTVDLKIYSVEGKLEKSFTEAPVDYSLLQLPQGIYFYTLNANGKMVNGKFVR